MKFLIITISVVTISTAVRLPGTWPIGGGDNFDNAFLGGSRPVREDEAFSVPNPNYSANNLPNSRSNNLNRPRSILPNSPVDNEWVPVPNNGYGISPDINGFEFKQPLNNILNPQFDNANGIRKIPYSQQKQGPPRFIQKVAKHNTVPGYNNQNTEFQKSHPEQNQVKYITHTQLPASQPNTQETDFSAIYPVKEFDFTQSNGQNQIQYITYTTPLPVGHLNTQEAAYSTIYPVDNLGNTQTLNIQQAYPKVNNQNTAVPLRELDFNPNNPFPRTHQKGAVLKQTQARYPPKTGFQQPQSTVNFDFNLHNPFPQNGGNTLNRHQISQVPGVPLRQSGSQISPAQANIKNKLRTKPNLANLDFDPRHPFNKNYRDHRTHEPSAYDPNYDTQDVPKVQRYEHEKAPLSNHEQPAEVPTKPIYPGEGKWAKQRIKHKPFISSQKYARLEDSKEKPDGFDTFLEGQQLFENQKRQFGEQSQALPQNHHFTDSNQKERNNKLSYRGDNRPHEETNDADSGEEEEPFVPTRLYAQVRHSEDEKHLPPESDENGRLKELIKDSKVQTVYSEEGYEDSAYDHAGHEKNAENVEGVEEKAKILENDKSKIDIENVKKEESTEEDTDSEPAGTHHKEQPYINKVKPAKKIFSAKTNKHLNKRPNMNKNDITKSKEIKTVSTIDRGNGNTEMEISSEVKFILQPNNSTKAHKYVTIYPKMYKSLHDDNLRQNRKEDNIDRMDSNAKLNTGGLFIEEISDKLGKTSHTNIFTTVTPTEFAEIFTVEIPTTTQATTAIPKVISATLDLPKDSKTQTPEPNKKINKKTRSKRDVIDYPKIEVDTDFIDDIKHELGKPKKPKDLTKVKYPYYQNYKEKGLHENSPLRYSESLKNVPIKIDGNLAFYDQANRKMECSEVDPIVDPVPDRIKDADETDDVQEESDEAESGKSPRLGELGDKIDCFKVKYFGENPLDSPFFQEELVGPVKPIFKEMEKDIKHHSNVETGSDVKVFTSRHKKRNLSTGQGSPIIIEQVPSASGYEKENEIEEGVLDKFFGKKLFNPSNFFSPNRKGNAIERISKYVKKYLDKNVNKDENEKKRSSIKNFNNPIDDKQLGFNILTDVVGNMKNPKDEVESIKIAQKLISTEPPKEVRTHPPATLITTPMYTINLKPKHIYDQIELLRYLPDENFDVKKETVVDIPNKNITETVTDFPKMKNKHMKVNIPDVKRIEIFNHNFDKEHKLFQNNDEKINKKTFDDDSPEFIPKKQLKVNLPVAKMIEIFKHDSGRKSKLLQNNDEKINIETFDGDSPDFFPKKELKVNIPDAKTIEIADHDSRKAKLLQNDEEKINIESFDDVSPEFFPQTKTKSNIPDVKNMEIFKRDFEREAKLLHNDNERKNMEIFDDVNPESLPEADALKRRRRIKPKRPLYQIFDINKYLPKVPKIPYSTSPKQYAPAFTTNSNFFYATRAPAMQIFDINKFLPTTPYPLFQGAASNTAPKYKAVSEVFYKDEIKPSEQLNVFNDVLNNIKNSPEAHQDNSLSASQPIAVKLPTTKNSTTSTKNPTIHPEVHQNSPKNHQTSSVQEKHFETSNKIKRRRNKTTTQRVPEVTEETTPFTDESISEESTEVVGLMPPVSSHRYKTIYNPKRDNSLHVSNHGITDERAINKYIVPGMQPPPKQRVYIYSDYLTDNHIRRRTGKPKRYKRSANRPAYAEVSRNKNREEVTEKVETKKDDGDDYVPHRPKNYHYDEKTGKIVYDKKPEVKQDESEEEVEYVEIQEETPKPEVKPKQNPIFATATPPPAGESYIDFVNLLKGASNYHEIPDPTTTEKGKETTTENVITTTIKPLSTTPPEFLSILAKVRNDDNYKLIEDKKKTTTESPEEVSEEEAEEVEETEEKSQVTNGRNSPGRHSLGEGTNLELFDIVDFLPNIKSYLPRTSIDTSKYKSIERPTLRHGLSSRYNSEEDKDLQNVNTSRKPILSNEDENDSSASERKIAKEESETKQENLNNSPSTRTATPAPISRSTERPKSSKLRTPNRRRTTTLKSTVTTEEAEAPTVSPVTTASTEIPHNDKARRTYRRKSPRIRLRTTTEQNDEQIVESTTEAVRRRSERDSGVPNPLDSMDDDIDYEESESKNDKTEQIGDTVTPDEKLNGTTVNVLPDLVHTKKKVEIIKDYDRTQKHGGNYKKENEETENRKQSVNQNQSNVKKPVVIFKNYDKTKKHGGNYKSENKDTEIEKQTIVELETNEPKNAKDVDIFKTYDETKKHGGNYRSENEDIVQQEQAVDSLETNVPKNVKQVDTFKTYDQNKKHGGNYRSESDNAEHQKQAVASTERNEPENVKVDTFKTYEQTEKHGGNYRPENEDMVQQEQTIANLETNEPNKVKEVDIFKNYDETKKHGGNYRSESEDVVQQEQADASLEINEPKNVKEVDTFKTYDESKKHGGNYRSEDEEVGMKEQLSEESQVVQPKEIQNYGHSEPKRLNDIEVIKKYDSEKKHGGNYKSEADYLVEVRRTPEENNSQTKSFTDADVKKDIEIFNNYDKQKKHGGNYKHQNEQRTQETQFNKIRVPDRKQQKKYSTNKNTISRLTDVVLKPESFYTDGKLPIAINELNIVTDLSNDELEGIVASVEEEQLNEGFGNREEPKVKREQNVKVKPVRGTKVEIEEISQVVSTTKKPLFIKDPSKRLYFYAPVR